MATTNQDIDLDQVYEDIERFFETRNSAGLEQLDDKLEALCREIYKSHWTRGTDASTGTAFDPPSVWTMDEQLFPSDCGICERIENIKRALSLVYDKYLILLCY